MCVCENHVNRCKTSTLIGGIAFPIRFFAMSILPGAYPISFSCAGGPSMYCVRWSNEAATVHANITADHRDIPANFSVMGRGSTQEPPSQFFFFQNQIMQFLFSARTVFAI